MTAFTQPLNKPSCEFSMMALSLFLDTASKIYCELIKQHANQSERPLDTCEKLAREACTMAIALVEEISREHWSREVEILSTRHEHEAITKVEKKMKLDGANVDQ